MSVYKSKFQPVMERWSLALKIVLLTTGLMFLLRTFILQSLQEQIASLLLGGILVSIYIYMLIVIFVRNRKANEKLNSTNISDIK